MPIERYGPLYDSDKMNALARAIDASTVVRNNDSTLGGPLKDDDNGQFGMFA
jgi:hypothetical protein